MGTAYDGAANPSLLGFWCHHMVNEHAASKDRRCPGDPGRCKKPPIRVDEGFGWRRLWWPPGGGREAAAANIAKEASLGTPARTRPADEGSTGEGGAARENRTPASRMTSVPAPAAGPVSRGSGVSMLCDGCPLSSSAAWHLGHRALGAEWQSSSHSARWPAGTTRTASPRLMAPACRWCRCRPRSSPERGRQGSRNRPVL